MDVFVPWFSGYLFVRVDEDRWKDVCRIRGVVGVILSMPGKPAILDEKQIEILRAGLEPARVEPHPFVASGVRARISAGVLEGLEGFILNPEDPERFVISIAAIGQSISIDVDPQNLDCFNRQAEESTSRYL
jgi:transcription antitermination factor NusG